MEQPESTMLWRRGKLAQEPQEQLLSKEKFVRNSTKIQYHRLVAAEMITIKNIQIVHSLSLNIGYDFHVVLWIKHVFMRLVTSALFLFTFYTDLNVFWVYMHALFNVLMLNFWKFSQTICTCVPMPSETGTLDTLNTPTWNDHYNTSTI